MYTLFYKPGACSMAVHAVLHELGVPFELKKSVDEKGSHTPEMLKVNPRGSVPTLVEGELIIREAAAILIYLVERYNSSLLPREGKERATALEWLCFTSATLHPAYGRAFMLKKMTIDNAAKTQLLDATREQIQKHWDDMDARLANQPYIAGKQITAADILLTVIANWISVFNPNPIKYGSNLKRLFKEVSSRPSYQKALEAEKVQYEAAA